jgi:two-component system, OmpR family, KDP operon response regulator KdpE
MGRCTVDLARRRVTGPLGEVELTPTSGSCSGHSSASQASLSAQQNCSPKCHAKPAPPDSSYLRVHLLHLRQKLENDPARPEHLITEPGMGYRFRA